MSEEAKGAWGVASKEEEFLARKLQKLLMGHDNSTIVGALMIALPLWIIESCEPEGAVEDTSRLGLGLQINVAALLAERAGGTLQ